MPSPLVYATVLAGGWLAVAAIITTSGLLLELLAIGPSNRGDLTGATPFVESKAALSRLGTWIRVPGQRLRLATALRELAEIEASRGAFERAEACHLESIALFESDLGEQSVEARSARWHYAEYRRRRAGSSNQP